MGDYNQTIVDPDATAEDAEALAERVVAWLIAEEIVLAERTYHMYDKPVYTPGPRWSQVTNERHLLASDGLAVVTGRTVFFGALGSDGSPICPRCTEVIATERWTRSEGVLGPFPSAMDTWHKTGAAEVRCPACGHPAPLPEWAWEHNCFAFAYLGFEFWNGPRLRSEFISELGRVLGHRTRVVEGKI
ncbi:hypothetical protein ACFVYG_03255 [Streptomyces sp. NPDC058256]|uniref:hypothetical protein n=1 Tax=Streptomyces sp. NPDC058256 TaxID=3346408 RepID=UPI0036EA13C4